MIEHIVETAGKVMDVFAVKRSDEARVESLDYFVSELVTLVLDIQHPLGLSIDIGEVLEHCQELSGSELHRGCHFFEQLEEGLFARDKPQAHWLDLPFDDRSAERIAAP
jgi:hypothetical protein